MCGRRVCECIGVGGGGYVVQEVFSKVNHVSICCTGECVHI